MPLAALADNRANGLARWPDAPPNVRRWVEENREALATYRQGTERPDAFDRATGFDRQSFKTIGALSRLHLMVLLEASRREEQSDMAGAMGMVLRPAAHHPAHRNARFGPPAQSSRPLAQGTPQSLDDMGDRPTDDPRIIAACPG